MTALALLAGLAIVLAGCTPQHGPAPATPAGDVVLVTVEGWWDPATGSDPFAAEPLPGAIRFNDAMTPCPQVRPAVVSILTGQTPDRTGVRDDLTRPLPSDVPYLPELISKSGSQTAAFVANPVVGNGSGLERGIAVFDAPRELMIGPSRFNPRLRPAEDVIGNFATWARSLDAGRPFFAWIHLALGATDAPLEGAPASSAAARWSRLAAVLNEAGRLRDAAVVLVAVSGKIDPSDAATSGYFLVPSVLEVPMSYRPAKGRDVSAWDPAAPRQSTDLAAVIAEAAGVAATFPDAVSPADAGDAPRVRFAWTWRGTREFEWPVQGAAVQDGVFLVREGEADLGVATAWRSAQVSSPVNQVSLAEALMARPAWLEGRNQSGPEIPAEISAALDKGKVSIPHPGKLPPVPALRVRQEQIPLVLQARKAIQRAELDAAVEEFDRVARNDPGNTGARIEAAQVLAISERAAEARTRLNAVLALYPYHAEAWHWLSHAALVEKEYRKADAMLELSNALAPHNADVLYDLACTRSLLEDPAGADTFLRLALAAGYRDADHIERDTDLRNYRADPRYARFMQDFAR